jgi:hypothetical protein
MFSGAPERQGCLILNTKQFPHERPAFLRYILLALFLLLSSNVSFAQDDLSVTPSRDDALEEE